MGTTQRHRKAGRRASVFVRAGLAFGLILGVGAAVTDASWTDTELATTSFKSSWFQTESSADGSAGSFADHGSSALTMSLNSAALLTMAPAVPVTTQLVVRESLPPTGAAPIAGTLKVAAVSGVSGALVPVLQWAVYADTNATQCSSGQTSPSGTGSWLVGNSTTGWITGLANTSSVTSSAVALAAATGGASPAVGAPVYLCLVSQIQSGAASSYQNTSASATWTIVAISN